MGYRYGVAVNNILIRPDNFHLKYFYFIFNFKYCVCVHACMYGSQRISSIFSLHYVAPACEYRSLFFVASVLYPMSQLTVLKFTFLLSCHFISFKSKAISYIFVHECFNYFIHVI